MHARKLSFFLAALALAAPLAAAAPRDVRAPAQPLRGADCLDPDMARGFVPLDDRRILVDAGRRRYFIQVAASCWNLDFANVIGFRGDTIGRRVCGLGLDAVLVRGGHPCRIERMELISKDEYKLALQARDESRRARRAERRARRD